MAILYDGKGNEISVDGGGTTPTPTESGDKIYDKVIETTKVINLLDRTKSTSGRMQVPPVINTSISGCEVSDYIEILANNTYIAQVWDAQGKAGVEKIVRFDSEKNYLLDEQIIINQQDNIHYIVYTPEESGFIRFQYAVNTSATVLNSNPMFFLGDSVTTEFVDYTGEELDLTKYHNTINNEFKNTVIKKIDVSNVLSKGDDYIIKEMTDIMMEGNIGGYK